MKPSALQLLPRSVTDQHKRLTEELLPKALDVMSQTMDLDPFEDVLAEPLADGTPVVIGKKFNARINGQRLRAALGTVIIVERLGDQALKRQAGRKLNAILAEIRRQKTKGATIEGSPSRPNPTLGQAPDHPEDP